MQLKKDIIGATYFFPKGAKYQSLVLTPEMGEDELREIYRYAPTLFVEPINKAQEFQPVGQKRRRKPKK